MNRATDYAARGARPITNRPTTNRPSTPGSITSGSITVRSNVPRRVARWWIASTWIAAGLLFGAWALPSLAAADPEEGSGGPAASTELPQAESIPATEIGSAEEALVAGNQLFEEGRYEEALDAYERGYRASGPHPTLVYNLAATLHRLDRLPEAILWYSRGDAEDPWVQENLWLARRSLGSQQIPPSGWSRLITEYRGTFVIGSILIAWLTLLLVALDPKLGPRPIGVLCLVALALYGLGTAAAVGAPKAAVLLEDRTAALGPIPAGTEAWVRKDEQGFRILGTVDPVTCPETSIGLVTPDV